MKRRGRIAAAVVTVTAIALANGCTDTPPPAGEIVVAVETDVALPDSVDGIRIEVTRFGSLVFGSDYEVGAGKLAIPATLGLIAGKNPGDSVTIRLIARKVGAVKMLREITTTVPASRVANLRLPIHWLCDDSAQETSPGVVASKTCPAGQTCIAGDCHDATEDSSADEAATAGDFMGGSAACFDVVSCMGGGAPVVPDPTTCTFPKPANTTNLNVALAVDNDGVCRGSNCFVILDKAPLDGWRDLGGAIQLPHAVCSRIASGRVKQVVTSNACPTKTERDPVCGPWFPDPTATPAPTPTPTVVAGELATAPESDVRSSNLCPMTVTGTFLYFCTGSGTAEYLSAVPLPFGHVVTKVTSLGGAEVGWGGPWYTSNAVDWVTLETTPTPTVTLHETSTTTNPLPRVIGTIPNPADYSPTFDVHAAIDAQNLYIPGPSGTSEQYPIYAYPRAGGTPNKISTGTTAKTLDPIALVADADPAGFLYFGLASLDGTGKASIERFAKSATNGGSLPVATLPTNNLSQLTVSGSDLFFLGFDGRLTGPGSAVYRVAAAGGVPVTVYGGLQTAAFLQVDGDNLYWAANGSSGKPSIFKAPKAGGATPSVVVAELPIFPQVMAVGAGIYYATTSPDNTVHVSAAPK